MFKLKQVPVVNLKEQKNGNWVCGADELPYMYEGIYAAVCLPSEVVKFTVCVERLGLAETSGERAKTTDTSASVEVPKIEVKADATVKTEQNASMTTKFVVEGPLAEARGDALRQCAAFLGNSRPYQLVEAGKLLASRVGPIPKVGETVEIDQQGQKKKYEVTEVKTTARTVEVTVAIKS